MVPSNPDWSQHALTALAQMTYTSMFGIMSGYMYSRTANLLSVTLFHSICNMFGVPDIGDVCMMKVKHQALLYSCYVIGAVLFVMMFPISTELIASDYFVMWS